MPLLNKKPFKPQPLPAKLHPSEEVFVCTATNEVFRNYEEFFSRYYLCKTFAWTCELTGKPNLTYDQAVASEKEAQETIQSIPDCHRRAMLSLIHHANRSNMRTTSDEVYNFFKDRFILGEELDYYPMNEAKGSMIPVKVVQVIPPAPVKVPVINTPPMKPLASSSPQQQPLQASNSPLSSNAQNTAEIQNGPTSLEVSQCTTITPSTPGKMTPSTPTKKTTSRSVPVSPISFEAKLSPVDYQYVVESMHQHGQTFTVPPKQLCRPRNSLRREKIRLFLRNALYHPCDKSLLLVKDEYVKKYELGPSSVKYSTLSSTPGSGRKRSFSQACLDSFLSPKDSSATKKPHTLSILPATKPNKKLVKKVPVKTPKSSKSRRSSSQSSLVHSKTPSVPSTPKTPKLKPASVITPSSSVGTFNAKKAIKKAKMLKQLDLKGKFAKQIPHKTATEEELMAARKHAEQQRVLRIAAQLAERERKKEERMKKLLEQKEMRRKEKLKKLEWLKPRDDLLCEDSKPLPALSTLDTDLPSHLFGDAVMVLEFLYHFGPVFNLRDAVHTTVTYDKLEEALISCSPDTILFGLFKFLLQAIFAAMEEEHETIVKLGNKEKTALPSGNSKEEEEEKDGEGTKTASTSNTASRRSSVGSIPMEGLEEERSLDVRLAALKSSAAVYAKWSHLTQNTGLQKLVLDPYTCSEVLRLHLLSSGGYLESGDRNWCRYSQRGGFSDGDDPVLELRLNRPDLIDNLAFTPVYDMPPNDKLTLLSTLCTQLLMYAVSREHMDDINERLKELRRKTRELQNEERKRKEEKLNKNKTVPEVAGGGGAEGSTKAAEKDEVEKKEETKLASDLESKPQSSVATRSSKPIEEKQETEEEIVERVQQELQGIDEEIFEVSAARNLRPLGYDRFYNRYWLFPAIAGLFMENIHVPQDSAVALPPTSTSPSSSSPKSETTTSHLIVNQHSPPHAQPLTTQTSVITCSPQKSVQIIHPPSHPPSPSPTPTWHYFKSAEELDNLITRLNSRGNRELRLKQAIEKTRDKICHSISKCRFLPSAKKSTPIEFRHSSANEYLELYLREQILDIEEKIYVGGLGYIRDIDNRDSWRDYIENSGAAALVMADEKVEEKKEDDEVVVHSPVDFSRSVQELARALLQIQAGVEKRCLMPPLGTAADKQKGRGDTKKNGLVKESDLCLEQWMASLAQVTSFPQIFVHLSTLERAIAWRKSLMYVRCRICRRKGGDEYMLLCDGCDHGYHMYCLRPPLSYIPDGDWFCYDCCPVTPVKRKRRAPIVEVESSDSESDNEEEEETAESESNEEMEQEENHDEECQNQDGLSRDGKPHSKLRQSTRVQRKATLHASSKQGARMRGAKKKDSCKSVSPLPGRATHSKRKLLLDDLGSTGSSSTSDPSKAEVIISSIINLRCSKRATLREQESLEQQLCEALLNELVQHGDSAPFMKPVRRKDFPDYYKVITQPIDLKTLRQKLVARKYNGIDDFLRDVDLLFSNCSRYYKRRSSEAISGATLRKFFEQRYSDLGLRNLTDVNISGISSPIQLRSRRT